MAQVRTRKRGKTWSFIFEAGIVNGKRKVVEKGGYPTKDAAYKAGIEKYTDFIHGNIGITSESITLKDFMTQWLDEVVAVNVKARSMQTYQTLSDRQICPYLGKVKVQELTPAMLDAWLRKLQKLLEKSPFGTQFYIPLLLLYHTGMRLSEVLDLSWSDIDFTERKINLRRQLVYIKKKGYYFTMLKTESSKRYILIDDFLLSELQRRLLLVKKFR